MKFSQQRSETDVDEFEDVALLLEPDKEQSQVDKKRSWKDQFLNVLARGGKGDRAGFAKLDNEGDGVQLVRRKVLHALVWQTGALAHWMYAACMFQAYCKWHVTITAF